ncbi:MAG: hypothetical protein MZV70_18265 [Desulfobacterales bacterium]|nr:hypothetical protein [Desulfobacterales bacterium]
MGKLSRGSLHPRSTTFGKEDTMTAMRNTPVILIGSLILTSSWAAAQTEEANSHPRPGRLERPRARHLRRRQGRDPQGLGPGPEPRTSSSRPITSCPRPSTSRASTSRARRSRSRASSGSTRPTTSPCSS